jgi:quercetin dioxygenase-like cupin family protein
MTDTAKPTVFIDNDKVRVTEWRFAPGAATGWHRHEMDYVVVPLLDGQLRIVSEGGSGNIAELKKGVPYFRETGVEHDVINANDFEFAFIEVETKKAP